VSGRWRSFEINRKSRRVTKATCSHGPVDSLAIHDNAVGSTTVHTRLTSVYLIAVLYRLGCVADPVIYFPYSNDDCLIWRVRLWRVRRLEHCERV